MIANAAIEAASVAPHPLNPIAAPRDPLPVVGYATAEIVHRIPLEYIVRHPLNRIIAKEDAQEMAESLLEAGQITPVLVRTLPDGTFQLIAGECRFEGSKLAGKKTLLCIVRPMTDTQAAEVLLLENLKRKNLTDLQEAKAYDDLLKLRDDSGARIYTLEKIAIRVHGTPKKIDRVARIHKLLDLPESAQKALSEGTLKPRVAFLVARIQNRKLREKAAKEVVSHPTLRVPMTHSQAVDWIAEHYQVNTRNAPFDREDPTYIPPEVDEETGETKFGACSGCSLLAKNCRALEGDLAKQSRIAGSESGVDPNTCLAPDCYHKKVGIYWTRLAEAHKTEFNVPGYEVLPLSESADWFLAPTGSHDPRSFYTLLRADAPVVALEADASRYAAIGKKAPTWERLLKGSEIPVKLAAGPKMTPIAVVDKKLAIAAVETTKPELAALVGNTESFTESEIEEIKQTATATGTPMVEAVEKAKKKKAKDAAHKRAVEAAIAARTKIEVLRAISDAIANGNEALLVEALDVLWSRIVAEHYDTEKLAALLDLDPEKSTDADLLKYPAKATLNRRIGLIVAAQLQQDHEYSGEAALGYRDLVKVCKVKVADIGKTVSKEAWAKEKARAEAESSKERKDRDKKHRNSTDPVDWTPESEAAKTAAADQRAKEAASKKPSEPPPAPADKQPVKVHKNARPGETLEEYRAREKARMAAKRQSPEFRAKENERLQARRAAKKGKR